MVGVQDEDAVHRPRQDRIGFPILGRDREAHLQEVLGVTEVVPRMHEGLTLEVFERPGRDRRHFGDHAMSRDHPLFGIIDVGAVVIEGRQGADGAGHDRHRVSIPAEALEKPIELFVQHRVVGDVVLELGELRSVRQLAVQQQVADLEEARLLSQFVDGIATMQQNAGVAVDVGDLAFATGGGREAGIVGEGVAFRVELADIDDIRAC